MREKWDMPSLYHKIPQKIQEFGYVNVLTFPFRLLFVLFLDVFWNFDHLMYVAHLDLTSTSS